MPEMRGGGRGEAFGEALERYGPIAQMREEKRRNAFVEGEHVALGVALLREEDAVAVGEGVVSGFEDGRSGGGFTGAIKRARSAA